MTIAAIANRGVKLGQLAGDEVMFVELDQESNNNIGVETESDVTRTSPSNVQVSEENSGVKRKQRHLFSLELALRRLKEDIPRGPLTEG